MSLLKRIHSAVLPVLGACLLEGMGCAAAAQDAALAATEPASLTAARQESLNRILTGSRQLTEQYLRALARLEEELLTTADYEGAMVVHSRIQDLESILTLSQVETTPGNAIALSLSSVKTTGTVVVDGETLTGWRVHGGTADWTLPALVPGRYLLELSYNLSDAPVTANGSSTSPSRFAAVDTAVFKFSEVSLLTPANVRNIQLSRSVDSVTYATARTEPLVFSRSRTIVRLEAAQAYPANVIRLKDIRLVPVPESAPTTMDPAGSSSTSPPEQDVSAVRQVFQRQLATVRAPVLQAYQAQLRTFAAQPAVSGDRDLQDQIEAEQKRIQQELAAPAPIIQRRARGRSPGSGMDGFDDLTGARLVSDPASRADRIKVEHDGRQFWISLAWVRCPPATPEEHDALAAAARHFGISEEDALTVGRVAREFTQGYLEGKPLRLLVRPRKEEGQPAQALVFLDGVGLYQTVLIDHGFASLSLPQGGERKPILEAALIDHLREREQRARTRRPAPGAWAFGGNGGSKP